MADTARQLLVTLQDLSSARDLAAVMAVVRRAAREITGADGATFVLRDGGRCFYADEDAIAPLWKGRRFPMEECISGWVMLNRTSAVIEDVFSDPRIPADVYRPTFVRSLAMVPVRATDPIAAIGVYWSRDRRPTDEELRFLRTLADAAALALANVQLYDDLRSALAKEQSARAEAERALGQLRRSEAQREAARLEAEAANRTKDEFLMLLSHELRTPLMPLLGWVRLLRAGDLDPASAARGLEVIERNAQLELGLVDELLDVTQMMSGQLEIERNPVDLAAIVEAALKECAPAAEAKGLRLRHSGSPSCCFVLGDAARLRQIMRHLLSNAIKFTPAGGLLTVELGEHGRLARITVADTGIGLARESLRTIFDRFGRVDASTTREHSGLGLGLALTRCLVELHGGQIEAASGGEGRGAIFTVRLPRTSSDAPGSEAPGKARAPVASIRKP